MPQMTAPLFGFMEPAPFQGRTRQTRETGASGARAAMSDRTRKIDLLRRHWKTPHTLQEIASITGIPLASVCSLKGRLDDELTCVGEIEKLWADGRVTRRSVWQLTKKVSSKGAA